VEKDPSASSIMSSAETPEKGSTPNTALLVTPPRCTNETDGVSMIESLQFITIITDISQRLLGKESSFGARAQDEEEEQHVEEPSKTMQELEERPISIVPSQGKLEVAGSFDVCQEYGYKYDTHDQQEEEDDSSTTNPLGESESCEQQPLHDHSIYVRTKTNENIPYIHLLGKTYHPILEFNARREYEHSLFWFTYRCDFPEIVPYRIATDAGWGCMLRSAQMLLAQTLRVHFQSRYWKPATSIARRRLDPFVSNLLTWFADFPSKTESVYSLHNMVAAGLSKYETLPGEWYGPGTACYVIRDLVAMHEQHQPSLFRVHVAPEGAVYRDAVQKLMTKDSKQKVEERQKGTVGSQKEASAVPLHPLDPSVPAPAKDYDTLQQLEWDTGLLLLVPLRLGLNNFHQDYIQSVARSFSLPQSVGILGGRPRGARWFYGAYADGSKVLGLDPHTVQTAPQKRGLRFPTGQVNHGNNSVVDLSDEYMRSVHTTYPEVFPIARMDPSIALGFYCRDKSEFAQLEAGLAQLKSQLTEGSPDLFTFADHAPDYSSSAMNDMMLMDSGMGDEGIEGEDVAEEQASDEDEYVLL
jgi:cysteine protease ATG4